MATIGGFPGQSSGNWADDPYNLDGTNYQNPTVEGKIELIPQARCNCESQACEAFHADSACQTEVDESCPDMIYLEKVCVPCANRISDDGGAQFITWHK